MVGFGGAAGQHICEIADLLGIDRILHSQESGLLSALGMGLAAERRDAATPVYEPLKQVDLSALQAQAQAQIAQMLGDWELSDQSKQADNMVEQRVTVQLRYQGTDASLALQWPQHASKDELIAQFHALHRTRYGYARLNRDVELVSVRCSITRQSSRRLEIRWSQNTASRTLTSPNKQAIWMRGQRYLADCFQPDELVEHERIVGPAIILSPGSTLVIESGWQADSANDGTLLLTRVSHAAVETTSQLSEETDPVAEAVFAQRLAAIATQMGLVLQQTALSVNVKQRRDFSCAIFDSSGRMLASAPHVPVHLGAMGSTVRAAMTAYPDLAPGDVVVTNNPYAGGSHLPDVTVISGIFASGESKPAMVVANRAHHADIGGMAPGSMCVTAARLGDEGAIIPLLRLNAEQCAELIPLRAILESAQWPPRNIEENLADLRAQLAANVRGGQLIDELSQDFTWPGMDRLSRAVLRVAEQRVRKFVAGLDRAPKRFADAMDDGTAICVQVEPTDDHRLVIDFAGTGAVSKANFNANPSIVTAAVIYVLRCLIADDLPLNEGMLAAIDLRIPEGILNPPSAKVLADSPAVAAGNVETSQRIVDCLLGAFAAAAASQGTMNNLLFGDARFGFYETICGGSGATRDHDGASGVHTHMTNTRLTDPEVLETKFPARLTHFGLRPGSGGVGRYRGGEGVIRRIEFLQPVTVSLLTSRRGQYQPYGLEGGGPGAAGLNIRIDRQGQRHELPAACYLELEAGESIELQTPGGGGFGKPT